MLSWLETFRCFYNHREDEVSVKYSAISLRLILQVKHECFPYYDNAHAVLQELSGGL